MDLSFIKTELNKGSIKDLISNDKSRNRLVTAQLLFLDECGAALR